MSWKDLVAIYRFLSSSCLIQHFLPTRGEQPPKNAQIDANNSTGGFTNTPAANYKVGLYTGQFTVNGKDYARKAVRFERKIELGMEGHRFFDLQRWDNGTGYMADILNAYIQHETTSYDYLILKGARFTKGKSELFPIPQSQIDLSRENGNTTLKQNPGY